VFVRLGTIDDVAKSDKFPVFREDVRVSYNPPPDGNCQFQCIARELRNLTPNEVDNRSHTEVRKEIVAFLNEVRLDVPEISNLANSLAPIGSSICTKWPNLDTSVTILHCGLWLKNTTFRLPWFRVREIDIILSSMQTTLILLGHLGEDSGAHYVCLKPSPNYSMDDVHSVKFSHITRKQRNTELFLTSHSNNTQETVQLPRQDTRAELIIPAVAEGIPDC